MLEKFCNKLSWFAFSSFLFAAEHRKDGNQVLKVLSLIDSKVKAANILGHMSQCIELGK